MHLTDVLTLARALMEEHDVDHWELELDRARRRAGQTDHGRRRITLSRHLMSLYSEAEVRETVLHEIAHARVGASHGHDEVWAAEARRIGASGRRLVGQGTPRVRGRWVGTCPAGHEVDRMRRPRRPVSCSRCARQFSVQHLLTWSLDGEPMSPEQIGEQYSLILSRVLSRWSATGRPLVGRRSATDRPPTCH